MPKENSRKAVWAVSIAVVIVAVVLIVLFALQLPSEEEERIVLPPAVTSDPVTDPVPAEPLESDFLNVTNDNVLSVLQTLSRPVAYHQSYTVTVGADDTQSSRKVEIWVNQNLLQAEISDDNQTKILVSDGTTAYLWYKGNTATISAPLDEHISEEDLLGLPAFDAFLTLDQEAVSDSGYLVLEDPSVQCIFVCTQEENEYSVRHWVNLENGLLYQSDVLENNKQIYTIRQTSYDLLATEDETFADRFILPNGENVFTAAEALQQP